MNLEIYSPYQVDLKNLSQGDLDLFTDKLEKLDKKFRNILLSADTPYFLEAICLTFGLPEDQSADLSRIVRGAIFGEIKSLDIEKEITSRLKINSVIARQIKDKLEDGLFQQSNPSISETPTLVAPQKPMVATTSIKNMPSVNHYNVIDLRNPKS